jgi:ribonuclease HI
MATSTPASTWPANRWRTREGNPVVDKDEWRTLIKAADRVGIPVEIEWVKGHRDSPHNRRADKLAKASATGHLRPSPVERKVRRKKSPHRVKRGSVGMRASRSPSASSKRPRLPAASLGSSTT